jgi:predicted phosphate transport protein (TIGR00153 family)
MNIFKRIFYRREDQFLPLLATQAELTLKGLEVLEEYFRTSDHEKAKEVEKIEIEADEIRRILIDNLNRTFITPIDREDIFSLSRAIDDVIDYAYTTVDEMDILHVEPNEHLIQIAALIRAAGNELLLGVRQIKEHPGVANEHAQRAKALENQVEHVYREALADLFKSPAEPKHIIKMLKLREVYRHLSNAADRGDEAANIIGDIVVKMA